DESFTAMINEEDHLRIQVFKTGLQLKECWKQINAIDDMIEQKTEYAFNSRYGYLTACPTNLGTGIRVSVMLHLPALKMTGQIEKFLNAARDTGLAVRGLFGEGTEAVGDFFQLSNQMTLGISEQDIVNEFTDVIVPKIIEYETLARQELLETKAEMLDDKIQRALGVLKSARLISSQEALFLLSNVRMGVNLKRVNNITISDINELFMLTQPAHLQLNKGAELDTNDRDIQRAEIIRAKLS
ncbi:MAG: ATP--guanido phosphotransferase, partial [Planctomycetes bacterium]|nr:ATP--guanido phosphotransferase [Planctomycetota bacterium]